MKAKLIVVEGRATKKEIRLPLPAKVGRSRDSQLTVLHPTVSRDHCELFERDGTVVLRDRGSSNGTLVGGEMVTTELELKSGDRLTVGPLTFELMFETADAREHLPPADSMETEAVASAAAETQPLDEIADLVATDESNSQDTSVADTLAADDFDLEALPAMGDDAAGLDLPAEPAGDGPVEPAGDGPVEPTGGEGEEMDLEALPAFDDADAEPLDLEPLSLEDDANSEVSAEIVLPDAEELNLDSPATEPSHDPDDGAAELEPLEDGDIPFQLTEETTDGQQESVANADDPLALDAIDDDEASLELMAEFEETEPAPAAQKVANDAASGELSDDDLDKFLNDLD